MRQQADLTLMELQRGLVEERKVQLSVPRLWWVLKDLGLLLKKSHSTRGSAIRQKRSSGGKGGGNKSSR